MKFDDLLSILPDNYNVVDRELIQRAYHFAEKAHEGQKRASGEPYISHCVAVAGILAELRVPPAVVIAGLLHDTVEDTEVTLEDIEREFGSEVARLVDGVTKLTNLPRVSRADQHSTEGEQTTRQSEYPTERIYRDEPDPPKRDRKKDLKNETLRKTFLAMGDDVRVVLIKLADRLHNMRTLSYMPESKRKAIAQETMDIFAPLANRLGIWNIKWELENLAFRYIDPLRYKEIANQIKVGNQDREQAITDIIAKVKSVIEQAGLKAEITGRPKHIYSIYRKMVEKEKTIDMLMDLRAIRLIVEDLPSCYAALGVIHNNWRPIPREFDDYIAAPKDNFYQSLHTAVLFDDGKSLEVQIRTKEMHESAEYGIAAHWRYKEKGKRDEAYEERINWLRRLMDWRQEVQDPQEFVDGMKSDVFEDRVYVFTPRGDIIDLPTGSTPIDFAYHVHTEIGNRCRGAKINGKLVSLDYVLKTGDQVNILTAKQGGPSRDWLNPNIGLVKTQRARSKIRQWFKKQDYEQNITQGKMIFDRELKRLGVSDVDLDKLVDAFDVKSPDDLYEGLGCGDISLGRIINRLSEADKAHDPLFQPQPIKEPRDNGNAITVVGLRGILTSIARCCNPAPGDSIVGYITRGRGVSVHRSDCPNIMRLPDKHRVIKVTWGEPHYTYPVSVIIKGYDRQGLLSDISSVISNEGINLRDINLKVTNNLATINLVFEVNDISQLSRILTRIENLPNVVEAKRYRPG